MSFEKEMRRIQKARDAGLTRIALGADETRQGLPGLVPGGFEQMVLDILPPDPVLADRARNFLQAFILASADLELCPMVNRMIGLHQFGIKTDVMSAGFAADSNGSVSQVTSSPFLYSRFEHSRFTAAIMVIFGLKLGFDFHNIMVGALAALLHDIGHPAFGHDIDDLLVSLGRPTHEDRGIQIIRSDADIQESFSLVGVSVDEVVAVIKEQGALGRLQSIADTLSYVVMDSNIVPNLPDVPVSFIWELAEAIESVDADRFFVKTAEPLRKLVVCRADMFRDFYVAPLHRIAAHSLRNFYKITIELGMLKPRDFEEGTDATIKITLTKKIQEARAAGLLPRWFSTVHSLAFGFFDEINRWRRLSFDEQTDAMALLNRLKPDELATAVVIEPFDYRRKAYPVVDNAGRCFEVQAPESHLSDEHKGWYVLYYPF